MTATSADPAALGKLLEQHGIETVHVGQFDYASSFRERRLGREAFLAFARDPRFANTLAHWDSADALFGGGPFLSEPTAIDVASLRRFAFEPNAATIIADFTGPSAPLMPRTVLKRQIERAAALGYDVKAAFEFEVIFLQETAESLRAKAFSAPTAFVPQNKCWSGQTAADEAAFVAALEATLRAHDVAVFSVAGELGPGCFEATLGAVPALRAADDAAFFRIAARTFARARGMTANFMPHLGDGFPGIGGHVTLSLIDRQTGQNLFSDPAGTTSALAKHFIGGMTKVVPQAFALCAHTVNAYRRFAPGSWAPKSVSWAEWTYTTAVRSAPSAGDTARLEFRLPGTDCNPHLALALMLGAGLDGIEGGIAAPAPAEAAGPDDIPPGAIALPRDLVDAAARLRASEDAARLFGADFTHHFARVCEIEHAALARAVSQIERQRYLEG